MWTIDGSLYTIDSCHTATIPIPGPNTGKLVTLFGDSASKWQKAVDLQYGSSTNVTIPATGGFSVSLSECPKYLVLDNDVSMQSPIGISRPQGKLSLLQNGRRVVINGFTLQDKGSNVGVYNVQGRIVNECMVDGQTVVWKGVNKAGFPVSNGLYIARINGGKRSGVFKIMMSGR